MNTVPTAPSTFCEKCLGWVWRVQIPYEEVLGALGYVSVHLSICNLECTNSLTDADEGSLQYVLDHIFV